MAETTEGWNEWNGDRCPVPAAARVEVMQGARIARGVACAFDWRGIGPHAVLFWRFERPVKAAREFDR